MNRRSFLKFASASMAAVFIPKPPIAPPTLAEIAAQVPPVDIDLFFRVAAASYRRSSALILDNLGIKIQEGER